MSNNKTIQLMKKILLSLAMSVIALVSVAQETTKLTIVAPNQWWGSKDVTASTAGKIDFTDQYGEFNIKKNLDLSVYTGMIIEYKDAADTQIKIQGDAADETTYSKKAEVYIGLEGAAGTQTVEFPASLGTKIEALSLQGLAAGGSITFEKITLLKGEAKEVATDFAGMSWGGSYTKVAGSTVDMMVTDSYGEIGFKEPVSYAEGKSYTYTVTFSEPTPAAAQFKVLTVEGTPGATFNDYDSKYYVYSDIPAGATSATIAINYVYESVTIQCETANVTFKGMAATLTVGDAASIVAPEAAKNGAMYNVAGQRINAPKGIYIMDGKKYYAK